MQRLKPILLVIISYYAFAKAESLAAQSDLENALTDMILVSDRYTEPAAEAAVNLAGTGWYYTAKPLELFKVNASIQFNTLLFPENRQKAQVSNDEFLNFRIRGREEATIPTLIGGDSDVFYDFTIYGNTFELETFQGIDTGFIAYPYVQAQVGLWYDTEVIVRYAPAVDIDKSSFGIYGLGLKHRISRYFMPAESSIDVAVLSSFSYFDLNLAFDEFSLDSQDGFNSLATIDGALIDSYALQLALIASKRWKKYTVATGVSYNRSWVDYRLTGNDSLFLGLFNDILAILQERRTDYRVDLSGIRHFNKWDATAQLSYDQFISINVGAVYKIK